MNLRHKTSIARVSGLVLMLCAWAAVSNHCALAMLVLDHAVAASAEVHSCCGAQSEQPEAPSPVNPADGCCKQVRVVLPQVENVKSVELVELGLLFAPAWQARELVGSGYEACLEEAAGRPREVLGFVDLVLQRSLPSMAPPSRG